MRTPKFIQKRLDAYADRREAERDAKFAHSSKVSKIIARRNEEKRRKLYATLDDKTIARVAEIINEKQRPLEYKMAKGNREMLARYIVLEISKIFD